MNGIDNETELNLTEWWMMFDCELIPHCLFPNEKDVVRTEVHTCCDA